MCLPKMRLKRKLHKRPPPRSACLFQRRKQADTPGKQTKKKKAPKTTPKNLQGVIRTRDILIILSNLQSDAINQLDYPEGFEGVPLLFHTR